MSQPGRGKEGERGKKEDRTQSVFLLSSVEALLKRLEMQGIVSRNMLCCFFKIDECKRSAYAFIVHVVQQIHQDTLM